MFIDEVIIELESGSGGDGTGTFRREKGVQFGGPNGGDGGHGGNIIFQADSNLNTLAHFKHKKKFKAESGMRGQSQLKTGKSGDSLIIKVPVGTVVTDMENNSVYLDLNNAFEERIFLNGGRGGRGNFHFKSSVNRAPKLAEKGKVGEKIKVKLELKILADVGLIGYPSVGKSTFINRVANSKAKVAAYHFTTLSPNMGIVNLNGDRSFLMADIPGLIEGAHLGKGLGINFLKHVERCKVLLHFVDIAEIDNRDVIKDFESINSECLKYDEILASKPQIIVANKIDILQDSKRLEDFREYIENKNLKLFPISNITGEGINELLEFSYSTLQKIKEAPHFDEEPLILDKYKNLEEWVVEKEENNVYNVGGRIVEGVVAKYLFNENEMENYMFLFRKHGIEKALRKAGVKSGDVVRIKSHEFLFRE